MRVNLVISENCCNFIVLNYKVLQTIIAMITESKVIELFCMADDFCKFFDAMTVKYTFKPSAKHKYHRDSTMSKAEIMLIMILFHDSGYRCLKHFYQEKVCKHMRHFFPKVVSYNRFVELEKDVAIPRWPYSSRRYFWANVQASVLLTALLYGYARTREYIFIKRSRE